MRALKKVAVVARQVSLSYGQTPVLRGIDLVVEPGEMFALLGPSGSGKTSLLRLIAGFQQPDSGQVLIDGHDVTAMPPHLRNVGMVFQNYALWPHLDVWDNVAFGLVEKKMKKDEIGDRVRTVLGMVGLADYARRRPSTLSGGQQQRVALARTIVVEPQVLLLDEPLSNLDKQLRVQMRHDLRTLQQDLGVTTIFVTHDQEEAMTTADRVAVLEGGVLQQAGSAAGLFDFPRNRFVAGFVGTANVLEGRIVEVNGEVVRFEAEGLGRLTLPRLPETTPKLGAAAMSFRPHQVALRVGDEQVDASRVWLDGNVLASEFMGEFSRYRVRVGDVCIVADQPHYSGLAMFPAGAKVRLGIEPTQVRFLDS